MQQKCGHVVEDFDIDRSQDFDVATTEITQFEQLSSGIERSPSYIEIQVINILHFLLLDRQTNII